MKPTPEIAARIISFIKGGAKPETAAEVCGISSETFDLWKGDPDFLKRIDTALAEARLLAEIKLRDKAPVTWLNNRRSVAVEPEVLTPRKRRRRGQPTRCTPAVVKIVCDTVRKGNYLKVAAKAAGISTDALNDWKNRGETGEEPYATFLAELEQADRDCEVALVAKVMAASDEDWRAAAMMLERKYPERWGRMRDQDYPGTTAFQIEIVVGGDQPSEVITIPRVEKFSVPALTPPDEPNKPE